MPPTCPPPYSYIRLSYRRALQPQLGFVTRRADDGSRFYVLTMDEDPSVRRVEYDSKSFGLLGITYCATHPPLGTRVQLMLEDGKLLPNLATVVQHLDHPHFRLSLDDGTDLDSDAIRRLGLELRFQPPDDFRKSSANVRTSSPTVKIEPDSDSDIEIIEVTRVGPAKVETKVQPIKEEASQLIAAGTKQPIAATVPQIKPDPAFELAPVKALHKAVQLTLAPEAEPKRRHGSSGSSGKAVTSIGTKGGLGAKVEPISEEISQVSSADTKQPLAATQPLLKADPAVELAPGKAPHKAVQLTLAPEAEPKRRHGSSGSSGKAVTSIGTKGGLEAKVEPIREEIIQVTSADTQRPVAAAEPVLKADPSLELAPGKAPHQAAELARDLKAEPATAKVTPGNNGEVVISTGTKRSLAASVPEVNKRMRFTERKGSESAMQAEEEAVSKHVAIAKEEGDTGLTALESSREEHDESDSESLSESLSSDVDDDDDEEYIPVSMSKKLEVPQATMVAVFDESETPVAPGLPVLDTTGTDVNDAGMVGKTKLQIRIIKMLRLGLHPDTPEEEAKHAMRIANHWLTIHNISEVEMRNAAQEENAPHLDLGLVEMDLQMRDTGRKVKVVNWILDLACVVAQNFEVEFFHNIWQRREGWPKGKSSITMHGLKLNAQLAVHSFALFFERIQVLALKYQVTSEDYEQYEEEYYKLDGLHPEDQDVALMSKSTFTRVSRKSYAEGAVRRMKKNVRKTLKERADERAKALERARKRASRLRAAFNRGSEQVLPYDHQDMASDSDHEFGAGADGAIVQGQSGDLQARQNSIREKAARDVRQAELAAEKAQEVVRSLEKEQENAKALVKITKAAPERALQAAGIKLRKGRKRFVSNLKNKNAYRQGQKDAAHFDLNRRAIEQ